MKVLKKQGVAWALTAVMIALAGVIGLSRGASRRPGPVPGGSSYAASCVYDDAGVLSASVEDALDDITERTIARHGAAIAVVTCNYGRSDLGSYALDYAEDIGLGGSDFIIVLDISGDNYWLVQGADLIGAFTDQDCSDYAYRYLEADFARGDYDGAALSLAQALSDWYDANF